MAVKEYVTKFKQMVAQAGRDPDEVPITLFGGTEDVDRRTVGVVRVFTTLPQETTDNTLPVLDRRGDLICRVNA
jgi:hypothetical protein